MKYMLLLYGRNDWWESATPEEMSGASEAHGEFIQHLKDRGLPFSFEILNSPKQSAVVRPKGDGEYLITDGPLVELKENLGGIYIIEAADMEDAKAIATKCPAEYACEIRPVVDVSEL